MTKAKSNIAFVSNTSWSLYNFRIDVIEAFLQCGCQVFAIAPRDEYSDKLSAIGAIYIPLRLDNYGNAILKDIQTIIDLHTIYRTISPDIIFHYTIKPNLFGGFAAKLCGLKYFNIITGLGKTFELSGLIHSVVMRMYRFVNQHAQGVWFLNKENLDQFMHAQLVVHNKTLILPSEGINELKFKSSNNQHSDRWYKFLFAGRILKDKGIYEFVNAAKFLSETYSNLKFEVLGFTNPENKNSISLKELEKWQKEGIINYLGSHEDIRPYIDKCDCVIFPSYYEEGVSRILLESASMAKPIITTDHVGCRDVVKHNYNGLLVPIKSVDALISAIEYFISLTSQQQEEMGKNGRKLVIEKYSMDQVIKIYLKECDQILSLNSTSTQISPYSK